MNAKASCESKSKDNTKGIEWFHIPGFSAYRVNSEGEVWSCLKVCGTPGVKTGPKQVNTGTPRKKLSPELRPCDGRKRYTLTGDDGKCVRRYGSYFILLATQGPRQGNMEACHFDGDCTNDRPSNLRWDTVLNNKADMKRHGTSLCGENNGMSKLTEESVRLIRKSDKSDKELANALGVNPLTIRYARKGKTWKHVSK